MTYRWDRVSQRMAQNSRNGFTVVEIVVVIVVVGILAAITMISYNTVTNNADLQTAKTEVQDTAVKLNKHKANTGEYPSEANFGGLGLTDGAKSTFDYTYYSATNEFCLSARYHNQTVYLTGINSNPVEGTCS